MGSGGPRVERLQRANRGLPRRRFAQRGQQLAVVGGDTERDGERVVVAVEASERDVTNVAARAVLGEQR